MFGYYLARESVALFTLNRLPLVRLPIEKSILTLQPRGSDVTPTLIGGTDPFLYNPRKAVGGHVGTVTFIRLSCLLISSIRQNRWWFRTRLLSLWSCYTIHIFSTWNSSHYLSGNLSAMVIEPLMIWCFSTSGVPFDSRPIHVLIPATSVHQVVLSGKVLRPGTLTLRGCYVQAPGGNRREFILPITTDEDEEQLSRKKSMLACETGRSKYSGLESFPWEKKKRHILTQASTTTVAKSPRFLECKVVPEQPLLRIRRTSVTHGAVMLYDGETYGFDRSYTLYMS